jgi:hypothetical protein
MNMKKVILLMALLLIPAGLGRALAQDQQPGDPVSPEPGQGEPANTTCTGGTCGIRNFDGSWSTFNCPTTGSLVCPSNKICACVCSTTITGSSAANACLTPPAGSSQPDETQTGLHIGHPESSLRLASFLKTLNTRPAGGR